MEVNPYESPKHVETVEASPLWLLKWLLLPVWVLVLVLGVPTWLLCMIEDRREEVFDGGPVFTCGWVLFQFLWVVGLTYAAGRLVLYFGVVA